MKIYDFFKKTSLDFLKSQEVVDPEDEREYWMERESGLLEYIQELHEALSLDENGNDSTMGHYDEDGNWVE